MMRLSSLLLLASLAGTAGAQIVHSPQVQIERKAAKEDLSWLWQYTAAATDGNENGFHNDARLKPFLQQHLTAPQGFWNNGSEPLADVAYEFLAVPGFAIADDNRYFTATGCVPHFCPSRGMLFIDTGGSHPLVVFAAIDWAAEAHTTDQKDGEYTLWLFSDRALPSDSPDGAPHLPQPLQRSLGRFSAALNGGTIAPLVTRAFVIAPDGAPHELLASQTGVTRFRDSQPITTATEAPKL